eukprot:gene45908-45234_t
MCAAHAVLPTTCAVEAPDAVPAAGAADAERTMPRAMPDRTTTRTGAPSLPPPPPGLPQTTQSFRTATFADASVQRANTSDDAATDGTPAPFTPAREPAAGKSFRVARRVHAQRRSRNKKRLHAELGD